MRLKLLKKVMYSANKTQKSLVIGTMLLAFFAFGATIISFWSTCESKKFYVKQIAEIKKTIELEWRPYLYWEYDGTVVLDIPNLLIPRKDGEYDSISISDLTIANQLYEQADSMTLFLKSNVKYCNSGDTPLRITAAGFTTISRDEWVDVHKKSGDKLVNKMISDSLIIAYDVDYVVFMDSCKTPTGPKGRSITIAVDDFLAAAKSGEPILFYLTGMVEYESIVSGFSQFNTLIMHYVWIWVDIKGSHYQIRRDIKSGFEIYKFEAGK